MNAHSINLQSALSITCRPIKTHVCMYVSNSFQPASGRPSVGSGCQSDTSLYGILHRLCDNARRRWVWEMNVSDVFEWNEYKCMDEWNNKNVPSCHRAFYCTTIFISEAHGPDWAGGTRSKTQIHNVCTFACRKIEHYIDDHKVTRSSNWRNMMFWGYL